MHERMKIVGLIDRLSRIAHTLQFAEGLNPAQWEALRYVARANRNSCSPGALADFMGSTKGTVSQTLKALEAKGLVERTRKEDDRRAVVLTLTEGGKALLDRDPLGTLADAVGSCSEREQADLAIGMERLLGAVQNLHGIPEFGPCVECCHYKPETCRETNSVGCRCGISGELFNALEIDRICVDFERGR